MDDHPLFCDALKLTLTSITSYESIEKTDCEESALIRLIDGDAPALILLDLNLPDVSGLDGLIRLKRAASETPVSIVSSMNDNAIINGALAAGASGFVPKHSKRAVFKEAVDKIANDATFTPSGFVENDLADAESEALSRLSSLTNQQARILELICEGKLNKQIAFDLSIAETTVKAHVTAIMCKLCVQSRTQAVLLAQNAKFSKVLLSHL